MKRGLVLFFSIVIVGVLTYYFINTKTNKTPFLSLFDSYSLFETEGKDHAISSVTRIAFSPEKIFILDNRQKKVFVFSESLLYQYSIGQPGQGPGDLENPVDLAVKGDQVVVLDLFSKRLDIFRVNGEFIRRVNLKLPKEIFYSYPSALLVDKDNNYLVAYSLSAHLLDVYDPNGDFKETLLRREDPVTIYRKNIGNTSAIGFAPNGAVLYLNAFDGIFLEVFLDGIVGRQFRIPDNHLQKMAQDLRQAITKESKAGSVQTDIMSFLLFTNYCIDSAGRLYVCQMRNEEQPNQRIWVFADDGECRSSEIDLSGDEKVRTLYCWRDQFFFVTNEERIWISKRRAP